MKKAAKEKQSFIEIHRRKQIIEIAIDMIAAKGYQHTTLAQIADQAGISKGVIFYYFKNKEELVGQTGTALLEELRDQTVEYMKANHSGGSWMRSYVDAYFDFIRKNRQKFSILMEVGFNLSTSGRPSIFGAAEYEECRQRLIHILEKDRADITGERAAGLAAVIQGMLDGVGIQWVADPESVDLDLCRITVLGMIRAYQASGNQKGEI